MLIRRCWAISLGAVVFGLLATPAFAEPTPEQKRLMEKRDSERYKFDTPHGVRGGAARVTVKASTADTEKVVTDFDDYSKFISRFEKSRVVGHNEGKTDVYLQVPIMKGAAKIWAVLRFEPPKAADGVRVVEGHLIKGNVKRLDATWRIRKIDDKNSQLNLEMVIIPKFPLPDSVVEGETAYAADVAVMGARNHAEKQR